MKEQKQNEKTKFEKFYKQKQIYMHSTFLAKTKNWKLKKNEIWNEKIQTLSIFNASYFG